MASQTSASLRSLSCELGLLNKTDGSASFSQGSTSVMVGAYGPAEVRINKEIVDKATVEVVFRPKIGIPGCAEKAMERLIRNTCDAVILTSIHPRSAMTIVVQELHNDGSLLSCAINSACMAMLNTGFAMKQLVASVTCAVLNDGIMQTDPTLKQEKGASRERVIHKTSLTLYTSCFVHDDPVYGETSGSEDFKEAVAVFTFAFEAGNMDVLMSTSKGVFTVTQYEACLLVSRDCAQKIFDFYRSSIRRKLSKDVKFMDLNIESKKGEIEETR